MSDEELKGVLARLMRIVADQEAEIIVLRKALESRGFKLEKPIETVGMKVLQSWENLANQEPPSEWTELIHRAVRLR